MSRPVLVRGHFYHREVTALLLIGTITFFIGVLGSNTYINLVGGICILASALWYRWRIVRRQWLQLEEDHFKIISHRREQVVWNTQVISLCLRLTQNYSLGREISVTRTLLIWISTDDSVKDSRRLLKFHDTFDRESGDPLHEFIERMKKQVFDHARDLLNNGKTFHGEGWSLRQTYLTIETHSEPLQCSVLDIRIADVVDDKLCLWCQGREDAWAELNINSINTYILKMIIDAELPDRPQQGSSTLTYEGFGHLIFERRPESPGTFILAVGTILFIVLTVAYIIAAMTADVPPEALVLAIALSCWILGALGCGFGFIVRRSEVFRFYENGLVHTAFFSEQSVRYEQIETFRYKAVPCFYHRYYSHTKTVFDVVGTSDNGPSLIRYRTRLTRADEEFDYLRDLLGRILGNRMHNLITMGQDVTWTPRLSFHDRALIVKQSNGLLRRPPIEIPLSEITSIELRLGQCQLFRRGQLKPLLLEGTHVQNFYPGYHCLLNLLSEETD